MLESQADLPSCSESPEDIDVLFLYTTARKGAVPKFSSKSELAKVAVQVFSDLPLDQSDLILKYFDKDWDEWVEIQEGRFSVTTKIKIKIETLGTGLGLSSNAASTVVKPPSSSESDEGPSSPLMKRQRPALSKVLSTIRGKFKPVQPTQGKEKKVSPTVKLQCGWLHYNSTSQEFAQVRSQKGGGVRFVTILRSWTYKEVLDAIVPKFYPNGKSTKGDCRKMDLKLANFQGQDLEQDSFSVSKVIEEKGLKTRIYLKTRETQVLSSSSSSDESSDEPKDHDVPLVASGGRLEDSESLDSLPVPTFLYEEAGTPTVLLKTKTDQERFLNILDQPSTSTGMTTSSGTKPPAPATVTSPTTCRICYDRDIHSYLMPCGHTLCTVCATEIDSSTGECPFCKVAILKVASLFQ